MTRGSRQSPPLHPGVPARHYSQAALFDLPPPVASKFCTGLVHVSRRLRARYMQARFSGYLASITDEYGDFGGDI